MTMRKATSKKYNLKKRGKTHKNKNLKKGTKKRVLKRQARSTRRRKTKKGGRAGPLVDPKYLDPRDAPLPEPKATPVIFGSDGQEILYTKQKINNPPPLPPRGYGHQERGLTRQNAIRL